VVRRFSAGTTASTSIRVPRSVSTVLVETTALTAPSSKAVSASLRPSYCRITTPVSSAASSSDRSVSSVTATSMLICPSAELGSYSAVRPTTRNEEKRAINS